MNKKFKIVLKLSAYLVGAFLIFFFAVVGVGVFSPKIQKYLSDRKERLYEERYNQKVQEIENSYKNDLDGGKTPEETLDLFVVALKAGDAVKASKYYELSLQEKALKGLKDELVKNGNLNFTADYFLNIKNKGVKSCGRVYDVMYSDDGCSFTYTYTVDKEYISKIVGTNDQIIVPKGSIDHRSISFSINKLTNIWKITFPY